MSSKAHKMASFSQINLNCNTVFIQQNIDVSSGQILTEYNNKGNSGHVYQNGNEHDTRLLQTGNGNKAQLNLDGGQTFTDVRQSGNENMISSNLNNLSKQVHSVLLDQLGNSNEIQLEVLGNSINSDGNRAISVNQSGNGLAFKGTYESNMLPVEIHQKSGAADEGMSVTVSTSAFYYPMK